MDTMTEARGQAAVARHDRLTSMVGLVVLVTNIAYVTWVFRDLSPPLPLALWAGYMALVAAAVLFALVRIGTAHTDAAAMRDFWLPYGQACGVAFSLGVMASVWVLLPYANPDLRGLVMLFYLFFLIVLMMSSSFSGPAALVSTSLVLGSLIVFHLVHAVPLAVPIAIFLALFGLVITSMRGLIRRGLVAEARARLMTEQALANAAAQQQGKARFIAAVGHDLQQPLQAAEIFCETAIDVPPGPARDRAIAGARTAFTASRALIHAMLEHLRLDAGAVIARIEPTQLAPLIARVADQLDDQARFAGIRIRVAPTTATVLADAALLERSLRNLVANAIRHSGGTRILIGVRRAGDRHNLVVLDNGRGIEPGLTPRLFEDYAQGHGQPGRPGGFGLGLASTRRQMALMNAEAAHDPRWTAGAAFILRLPTAPHRPDYAIAAE